MGAMKFDYVYMGNVDLFIDQLILPNIYTLDLYFSLSLNCVGSVN